MSKGFCGRRERGCGGDGELLSRLAKAFPCGGSAKRLSSLRFVIGRMLMNHSRLQALTVLLCSLAASSSVAGGLKVVGLPATEAHCAPGGLSWYFTANWKPLPYPSAATPWQKYLVGVKMCAQPAVDSYTCTATACSILITGCGVKVAWSKVDVIGTGLPAGVGVSWKTIPGGVRPGRCNAP